MSEICISNSTNNFQNKINKKNKFDYKGLGNSSVHNAMNTNTNFKNNLDYAIENDLIYKQVFEDIEGFNGKLIDVLIDTGALTILLYFILTNANIICFNYSEEMLGQAKGKEGR